jgi:hypothetical protein
MFAKGNLKLSGYKNARDYRDKYEKALFERLFFTPGSPLIFVSAMSGYEVDRMLNAAVKLNRTLDKKLPTAKLNQHLAYYFRIPLGVICNQPIYKCFTQRCAVAKCQLTVRFRECFGLFFALLFINVPGACSCAASAW